MFHAVRAQNVQKNFILNDVITSAIAKILPLIRAEDLKLSGLDFHPVYNALAYFSQVAHSLGAYFLIYNTRIIIYIVQDYCKNYKKVPFIIGTR